MAEERSLPGWPKKKLVKDVRTGYETSDTTAVLDGEIDPFIEAYLKSRMGEDEG